MNTDPDAAQLLQEWEGIRRLAQEDAQARFAVTTEQVTPSQYGQLQDLIELTNGSDLPGRLFYRDGQFVLLHVRGITLEGISAWDLLESLGTPDATLRSRAGKTHHIEVYGGRGLAISHGGDEIDFVQVFPPMSAEEYQATLYHEPSKFRR
jgi:hypothetical protein